MPGLRASPMLRAAGTALRPSGRGAAASRPPAAATRVLFAPSGTGAGEAVADGDFGSAEGIASMVNLAARVDPAIMSALEKAPKTTAPVDELTLKLEARITEQAAPIVARLAREEVVRHQLASAIEQRVARTAQQRTIEVLVGVAGGLLAGGAIASHFNNPRGSR